MFDKLIEYAKTQGVSREEINSAVQKKYRSFLEDKDFYALFEFESLKEFTGIEPKDLPEELVKSAYEIDKKERSGINFELIKSLTGIDCDPLTEDQIRAKYTGLLRTYKGWISSELESLMKSTGIKPEVDEAVVQKGYFDLSKDGNKLDDFDKLRKVTGVRPSDEAVNQYCIVALKNIANAHGGIKPKNIERLVELLKETGADLPEDAKSTVQEAYQLLLKNEEYSTIGKLKEEFGIELSEESVKAAQDKYCEHAKRAERYEMNKLKENTGVEPEIPEEAIQEGYRLLITPNKPVVFEEYQDLKGFFNFVGVKPDDELVQGMYKRSLKNNIHPGSDCSYRNTLGIDLSAENKKLAQETMASLWDIAADKKGYRLECFSRLVDSTGVEIPEELKMKIVGEYMNAAREQRFKWFQELAKFSHIEPPKRAFKEFLDYLIIKE